MDLLCQICLCFFFKTLYNRRRSQHVHAHIYINAYTHTLPYEHLREIEPADRVFRLIKLSWTPRCRRENHLSLKNIPPFIQHTVSNLRFKLWCAGGTTTL